METKTKNTAVAFAFRLSSRLSSPREPPPLAEAKRDKEESLAYLSSHGGRQRLKLLLAVRRQSHGRCEKYVCYWRIMEGTDGEESVAESRAEGRI